MRHNSVVQLVPILAATLCGPSSLRAHQVDQPIPLGFVGYSAPFGYERDDTYTSIWAADDLAVLGSKTDGVAVIDISAPHEPRTTAIFRQSEDSTFGDVQLRGDIGFFSSNADGTLIVDLSTPEQPRRISSIDSRHGGFDEVTRALLNNNRLYQVNQRSSRIAVFDLTDANSPTHIFDIETNDTVGISDVVVSADRLYAAGLGSGTHVFDLPTGNPSDRPPVFITNVPTGENMRSAQPTDDGRMLIVSTREVGGSIDAWEISDLASPSIITSVNASDVGISSYSPAELQVVGNNAYVAWHQAGLQVLDLDTLASDQEFQRVGSYGTATDLSPLDGFVGSVSVYAGQAPTQVLVADSKWGLYIVDASTAVNVPGDFDEDGVPTSVDLDILSAGLRLGLDNVEYDLNQDGLATQDDRSYWINNVANSVVGDSNLDGRFDSADLVLVFQLGQYEDPVELNGSWRAGDWNGDGEFDSGDLVAAFTSGVYESAIAPVPEPASQLSVTMALLGLLQLLTRRSIRHPAQQSANRPEVIQTF